MGMLGEKGLNAQMNIYMYIYMQIYIKKVDNHEKVEIFMNQISHNYFI